MLTEIANHRQNLIALCQRYRVRRLQLFGSAVSGNFKPATSDLDFVAEFKDTQALDYADRYFDFAEALEKLFNRRVEVVTQRSIRNPYFRAEVDKTAQTIYEESPQQALA